MRITGKRKADGGTKMVKWHLLFYRLVGYGMILTILLSPLGIIILLLADIVDHLENVEYHLGDLRKV